MKPFTYALLISVFSILSACSMSKDVSLAEMEVPNFHAALDSGKFNELYQVAAAELKNAATQQDFVNLLSAVNRELGKVTKTEKQTWNVHYNTSGRFVTLVYSTTFANGTGVEQFIYKLHEGRALLVGYHINSNALITS